MVYRRLIDKLLANLRQEVPPTDPMYLTVDEAILSLRWLTDEDFGQEVIAWKTWFDGQNYAEDVVCKGFVRQKNECEDATYHWFLDVYLPNLRQHDPAAHELSEQIVRAEEAYIKLRQWTDEDFGYDADGWEIWLMLHRFEAEAIYKGSDRRRRRPDISPTLRAPIVT